MSHAVDAGTFRVGSHHYARELARTGADVLHLSTSFSHAQALRARHSTEPTVSARRRLAAEGPRRDGEGVLHAVAQAVVPMRYGGGVAAAARLARRHGFGEPDLVLVDQPLLAPVVERLAPRLVVYRPTDVHPGGLLRRREQWLVARADAVVATSTTVLESLGVPASTPTLVLENGVELERFAVERRQRREGLVYVGAVDARFDWTAVETMARAVPDVPVRIVGPVAQAPDGPLPPNVELVGSVPYDALPSVLASASVGLLPTSDHPLNAGRSPMKFYEYLAAGLHVVARRTPTLAARHAPGVKLYRTPAEATAAVQASVAERAANAAGREHARAFAWDRRTAQLLAFTAEVRRGEEVRRA
ncbi:glycosyltransferase [Cellulomonas sp. NPDC057328]|uniref:glycosyltransferase family protein n=1 Tax=Cellulomonas sp. NPDC057328 TaxID=3346101 RepID=UPI0036269123